jgi:hypothetical protein
MMKNVTAEGRLAEKERLKAEYGSLFGSVEEILFRHDPIEINYGFNTDEYDPEVKTILPRLKTCRSVEDVASVVHEEFLHWFNSESVGAKERYQNIAEEIWGLWQERQKHSR